MSWLGGRARGRPPRSKGCSVAARDAPDDHGARTEVVQREVAGIRRRLDGVSGGERLTIDGRRERKLVSADGCPGRDAVSADDALAGAQDEVALELDAVG